MVLTGALVKAVVGLVAVAGVTTAVVVATSGGPDEAIVTRVVDGDTIDVTVGGTEHRVRLLNIDTPESVDPDRPVECLALEATAFLEDLLPSGTPVRLEYDEVRTDRYDRTLAGVFTAAGALVNAEIARAGLAAVVVFDDNVRFLPPVEEARAEAEAAGVGLYSADVECTLPAQVAALEAVPAVAAPPAAATSSAFTVAVNTESILVSAADRLLVLVRDTTRPALAVFEQSARLRFADRVDEVRAAAAARRAELQGTAGVRLAAEQAEAARIAEEARQAEQARAEAEAAEAREAEERRRRAEERDRASAPSPPSSGGSSSGGDTYTGKRCYEPGGVVYRPC
ncbi:thermonuclease family protein [Pseudonocardia broussonetiae]|uniref:Nuclease n=1 Tax=Pseudonocardia broussonetiae TaxID=2736640 RepID=A0A6M6JTR7_9PSEU|nr:thermonuclease family protein [Pseudonocardia broussonetiae]QJY49829.1 nuclease [Pseudonocardia broussonetiae]